jgi:hypothetical protein
LSQGEVEKLANTGRLEESVDFTPNPLAYLIHCSTECREIQVSFLNGRIAIVAPDSSVRDWAASHRVGMESTWRGVSVLIEKDWACAHAGPEENEDAFPNPGRE